MKRKRSAEERRYLIAGATLCAGVAAVCLTGSLVMKHAVVQNTGKEGLRSAQEMVLRQEQVFECYETVLKNVAYSLTEGTLSGDDVDLEEQIRTYTTWAQSESACGNITVFGVIDGHFVHSGGWEPPVDYRIYERPWYTAAVKADGETAYVDLYHEMTEEQEVVGISMKVPGTRNVIAVNILTEDIRMKMSESQPGGGRTWVLLDSQQNIVTQQHSGEGEHSVSTKYMREILSAEQSADASDSFSVRRDLYGVRKLVCRADAGNGWTSVVMIPVSSLKEDTRILFVTEALTCAIFFAMLLYMFIQGYNKQQKNGKYAEVMAVLGNTYYAVYLVQLETGQYRIIKGPADITESLKQKGAYKVLLERLIRQIHPDEKEKFMGMYQLEALRQLRNKQGDKAEGEFRRSFSGEYKWVSAEISFVPNKDKSMMREEAVFALKLIHEVKVRELEQQNLLAESLSLAQAKGEAKSDFLARMSHDMRTPMNAIIGLTELTENSLSDVGKAEEYLKKIRISSAQLLNLVNDVLDMSKIEQGKMELHETVFNLQEELEANFSLFAQQAEKEGKTFRTSINIGDCMVETDSLHVNQICNNILSNAFKFTPSGGRIEASVREFPSAYKGKAIYRMVFRDNGIGMSKEFQEKLFQPFEREYNSMTSQISGTGLGMPIVQSILQMMDGKISVWSERGKGTEVTITIPMKRRGQPAEKPRELLAQEEESLAGKRALLVEDNEINMEIAREILKMQGMDVECAWNGQEAVTMFADSEPWHYDVVLMDLQMPVMDGYTAARSIRSMERADTMGIPIIAMTANAFSEDIAKTLEAGMDAHVAKPVDFDKLKTVILEKLHEKRYNS